MNSRGSSIASDEDNAGVIERYVSNKETVDAVTAHSVVSAWLSENILAWETVYVKDADSYLSSSRTSEAVDLLRKYWTPNDARRAFNEEFRYNSSYGVDEDYFDDFFTFFRGHMRLLCVQVVRTVVLSCQEYYDGTWTWQQRFGNFYWPLSLDDDDDFDHSDEDTEEDDDVTGFE